MKRQMIQIDEDKCDGCAKCTTICAETALEVIDGKARVVEEFLCDGMGACLDVCPQDALKVVEKDVEGYDPFKAYARVKKLRGMEAAQKVHGIETTEKPASPKSKHSHDHGHSGCPGGAMHDFSDREDMAAGDSSEQPSQLRQWPVQLHLLTPAAPYFKNADLLIAADCVPFASANFHQKYLKGKAVAMFCPKLDENQEIYSQKLKDIFSNQEIKSATVVQMEVPCCGGVESLVKQAIKESGKDIPLEVKIISIKGDGP